MIKVLMSVLNMVDNISCPVYNPIRYFTTAGRSFISNVYVLAMKDTLAVMIKWQEQHWLFSESILSS